MGEKKSKFSDIFSSCISYIFILPYDRFLPINVGLLKNSYWFYLSLLTYCEIWLMAPAATTGLLYRQEVSVYARSPCTNTGREDVSRGGWE